MTLSPDEAVPPPSRPPGTPVLETLHAGLQLWRVHGGRPATAMSGIAAPTTAVGGRFDSVDGSYSCLYVGADPHASIAETLCRDLPLGGSPRLVPRVALRGRHLSRLDVVEDLVVVSAHGCDLSQLGAGLWLTKCSGADYLITRRWAATIRAWEPQSSGIAYRCRHDEGRQAWVLFTDPDVVEHPALRPSSDPVGLESGPGLLAVERVLARHNAALAR